MKIKFLLPSLSLLGLVIVHGQTTLTPPDSTTASPTPTPQITPTPSITSTGKTPRHSKSSGNKELKPCLKLAEKAESEIQKNDLKKAQKELKKFDKSWTAISASVKSKDETQWKKIDVSYKATLSAVRAGASSTPSPSDSIASLIQALN